MQGSADDFFSPVLPHYLLILSLSALSDTSFAAHSHHSSDTSHLQGHTAAPQITIITLLCGGLHFIDLTSDGRECVSITISVSHCTFIKQSNTDSVVLLSLTAAFSLLGRLL